MSMSSGSFLVSNFFSSNYLKDEAHKLATQFYLIETEDSKDYAFQERHYFIWEVVSITFLDLETSLRYLIYWF